jgi:hypothetical protein
LSQKSSEDIISVIGKIFATSSSLTKSQHFDLRSSSRLSPEVQLWLGILKLTIEDWLDGEELNYEYIKEIERWALASSSNTFGLNMIALSVYVAFHIEPEFFKATFRNWLRANYAAKKDPSVFKGENLVFPFETYEISDLVVFDTVDMVTDLI